MAAVPRGVSNEVNLPCVDWSQWNCYGMHATSNYQYLDRQITHGKISPATKLPLQQNPVYNRTLSATESNRRCLRSSPSALLTVRPTRLVTMGDRAFPVAGSRLWNTLPHDVNSARTLPVFCNRLNTYLFMLFFPVNKTLFFLASHSGSAVSS